MKENLVITISREYGSGGRAIGEQLAKELGIPYYDRKIIDLAAKETGFHAEFIESEEHRVTNSFLFNIATGGYMFGNMGLALESSLTDQVFQAESNIIRKIAEEGSCVIVGRCADSVLSEHPNCLKAFIHADLETRVARAVEFYGLAKEKAPEMVKKADRARVRHYQYYCSPDWGQASNYDITLNSGTLGIPACVEILKTIAENR